MSESRRAETGGRGPPALTVPPSLPGPPSSLPRVPPIISHRAAALLLGLFLLLVGGGTSLLLLLPPPSAAPPHPPGPPTQGPPQSGAPLDFYQFETTDARGRRVSLETYRGAVSVVVNVASECGYTRTHYSSLQQLYRELGPRHFTVLAFPCNQFGAQEPGSDRDVEIFARHTLGATFPIFAKTQVLGSNSEPALKFLFDALGQEPRWNFWKFLVDADGRPVGAWGPDTPVEALKPAVTDLVRNGILKRRSEEL